MNKMASLLILTMLCVPCGYAMSSERVFVEENMRKFGPLITLLKDKTILRDPERKAAVTKLMAQIICPNISDDRCALTVNRCTVVSDFGNLSSIMQAPEFTTMDRDFRLQAKRLYDGLYELVLLLFSSDI